MSVSVALEAASRSPRSSSSTGTGLRISRRYTQAGIDPFDTIRWDKRKTVISNPDGSVVFQMDDVEVPADWSQLATDIVVSKYFRKAGLPGTPGHETSVRQVVHRISHSVRWWGEKTGGYFASSEDADAFEAELKHMLVNQIGAFNSPVWFNCGLHHEYGINGSGGNFWWDPETQSIQTTGDSYSRPQVSACFIQSIGDDLMSIFELARNEARVFKYGSGTGTNFSQLRGRMEKLSGGGTSSGLMSFLEVLDKGAGATKSGGTTRRAAKMVVLDMDHPEIVDFVRWKMREEKKVAALVAAGYSSDFNGEAYGTVSGQNSNNSVRVPDRFMKAVETDGTWDTTMRTTGAVWQTHRARELWKELGEAAWQCADPGVQYDDTIQRWHTCKTTGRINATNPCSEYVFLDDTACNLASINLMKFLREDGSFDIEGYRHANRVFFLAQEILVGFASYPTERIAENSAKFRPLGLGYANLGTLLMMQGYPYDSDQARAYAASITAMMTGEAYAMSAEIAASAGTFDAYAENRDSMLDVMRLHRDAARAIDPALVTKDLRDAAIEAWDRAVANGMEHGYRNAQATVLAPTGTIGLLMDCDTTGIEPDFALVKFKKLAGGGYFKIVNQSVPAALHRLGYDDPAIQRIVRYAIGTGSLSGAPHINESSLIAKGFATTEIDAIEKLLPSVLDIRQAFGRGILGDDLVTRLGVSLQERSKGGWNALGFLGFTDREIEEANAYICGTQTVEGAPGLDPEHLPVFDCANRCGPRSTRYIHAMGHVRMMAAAQPFLSGAISKTVNLPNDATVENVEQIYFEGWKLGLKAIALYRDGSKLSQPLATKTDDSKSDSKSGSGEVRGNQAVETATVPTPAPLRRRRLPRRRYGFTQEARIAGHKVFIRTGEYDNGELGEIFIDMHKEGAAFRSMMNCFAISVSMGLQYGVPLEDLVDQFVFTRFEPQGRVEGHDNLKASTSVIDYIFRVLGIEYLQRTDLAHIVDESLQGKTTHVPAQQSRTEVRPGNGTPKVAVAAAVAEPKSRLMKAATQAGANPDAMHGTLSGDAPPCGTCGFITIRNGTCFKCTNCGTSMGCG